MTDPMDAPRSIEQLNPDVPSTPTHRVLLAFILAAACCLRLWHLNWDLPRVYEEAYPFGVAWKFWNWGHPGCDFNPHVFNYAALSFYIQFFVQLVHYGIGHLAGAYPTIEAYRLAYQSDPTLFFLLARGVSVVFDLGSIVLTYFIARRLTTPSIALCSSALLAMNPLHIREAHLVNVDTPLTFFVMLSLYVIVCRLYSTPSAKWYMLAGVSIGCAAATKYTGAVLLPILILAHCLRWQSIREALRSLRSPHLIISIALSGFVFILLNPYILLSFREFKERFSFIYFNVIEYGHLGVVSSESTLGFYLTKTLPASLGLPFAIVAAMSICYLIARRKREHLLLIVLPLLYLSIAATWAYRADRYILPLLPLLSIIGCLGLESAWGFLSRRLPELLPSSGGYFNTAKAAIALVVGVTILAPITSEVYRYQRTHERPDTRTVAQEWIA
ncbi:MAG TPA: glycosyltransferase family 39 protein, partial [Bacteroidota bacterium]|nr:glycosyltransferase family 39 protein [Bacteroidota bacterium]